MDALSGHALGTGQALAGLGVVAVVVAAPWVGPHGALAVAPVAFSGFALTAFTVAVPCFAVVPFAFAGFALAFALLAFTVSGPAVAVALFAFPAFTIAALAFPALAFTFGLAPVGGGVGRVHGLHAGAVDDDRV